MCQHLSFLMRPIFILNKKFPIFKNLDHGIFFGNLRYCEMLNSKERKSSLDIGFLGSTILSPSCDLCFDDKPDRRSSSYEWDLWKRKLLPPLDFHCRNLLHYVNLWLWHGSVQVGMCFQLISAICGAQSCVKVHLSDWNRDPDDNNRNKYVR